MKTIKYVAMILSIGLFLTLGVSSVVANAETVTVEKGDTLWSISKQYDHVSVADLYELNPGIDATNLQIGATITIRPTIPGQLTHIIEPGDTFQSIAEIYPGVTAKELAELNPDIDPLWLQPWTEIIVSSEKNFHQVLPGDTFFHIANVYDVTVADLYELNPDIDPYRLQVTEMVRIQ